MRGRGVRALAIVLLLLTAVVAAQEPGMWRGGWGRRFPPRFPNQESFDGRFNFCRLMYTSAWREPSGSGWNTDYPGADLNFPIRLGELTKTRISRQPGGESNHLVVRATDPFLYQCPFLLASDIGDSWEREGEQLEYFYAFSPNGYALGMNVAMYMMTH